jgi:hypothetical protein
MGQDGPGAPLSGAKDPRAKPECAANGRSQRSTSRGCPPAARLTGHPLRLSILLIFLPLRLDSRNHCGEQQGNSGKQQQDRLPR